MTRQLRLSHKLSTVYYLQIDRQTEWINQVIKQYLREYINYQQTNWVSLLLIAQLTYNISINAITAQTLFFTNYRYNVNLFLKLKKVTVLIKSTKLVAKEMQTLHKKLKQDIKFLLYCLAFYYN